MISQQLTVNDLLLNVQSLNSADFDLFFKKLQQLHSQKPLPGLTLQEHRLLQQINAGLPVPKKARFNYLIGKRDAETLNPEEYEELLVLTGQYEEQELKRQRLMSKLAMLRGISLPEVVTQFNLHPQPNA